MQYRTHQVGGLCAGIIAGATLVQAPYDLPALGAMTLIVLSSEFGSVMPDIDEPNSIAGRSVPLLSKLIKKCFGHRMITHTPLFLLLVACGLFYFGETQLIETGYYTWYTYGVYGFLVGYLSHFLMDSLNPTGIMYLWPLSKRRFSIMKLRTGKSEWIARVIFIGITLIYLYYVKAPELRILYGFIA